MWKTNEDKRTQPNSVSGRREHERVSDNLIRIGNREWETIKQSEDKGMKEILGLGNYG